MSIGLNRFSRSVGRVARRHRRVACATRKQLSKHALIRVSVPCHRFPISLAPGFSRVTGNPNRHNRFSGFPSLPPWSAPPPKPLKPLPHSPLDQNTRLTPGIAQPQRGATIPAQGTALGSHWINLTALKGRPILPRRTAGGTPLPGCVPLGHPTPGRVALYPELV